MIGDAFFIDRDEIESLILNSDIFLSTKRNYSKLDKEVRREPNQDLNLKFYLEAIGHHFISLFKGFGNQIGFNLEGSGTRDRGCAINHG